MGHYTLDTLPFVEGQTASAAQSLASPTGDGTRISLISSGAADTGTSPLYDTGDNSSATAGNSTNKFHPEYAGQIFDTITNKSVSQLAGLTPATLNLATRKRRLRAVQFRAALTPTMIGQGVVFDTAYGRDGVVITGAVPGTAGLCSKPLSDKYGSVGATPAAFTGYAFVYGDWAYVVEEGPCIVTIAKNATVTVGKAASVQADGTYADDTGDGITAGTWEVLPSSTASGVTYGILLVKGGVDATKAGTA